MTAYGQHAYSVNVIVSDIGLITDKEKQDVAAAIGHGAVAVIHFTTDLHQLHLYWQLFAETVDEALDEARHTLRQAINASGAANPRTRKIEVCQIGQ